MATPATPPQSAVGSASHSTSPLSIGVQGTCQHVQVKKLAEDLQSDYADEARGRWIGPVPVSTFFTSFMPVEMSKPRSLNKMDFTKMPVNPSHERDMYQPFVSTSILCVHPRR